MKRKLSDSNREMTDFDVSFDLRGWKVQKGGGTGGGGGGGRVGGREGGGIRDKKEGGGRK